jgi:hypothetical protein
MAGKWNISVLHKKEVNDLNTRKYKKVQNELDIAPSYCNATNFRQISFSAKKFMNP